MKTTLFAGILVAALAAPAAADRAEDDLQLVKKAVGSSPVAQARPPAEEPLPPRAEAAAAGTQGRADVVPGADRREGDEARQGLGEPAPRHRPRPRRRVAHCRARGCRENRHCPTLGEVLRALDSGQSLVEIEDDEATVRVWVE